LEKAVLKVKERLQDMEVEVGVLLMVDLLWEVLE
jgi:hypothetical protein